MPFDGSEGGRTYDAVCKIDRVIDLLATEDKWCKGQLETNDGRRCIVGAMAVAGAEAVLRKPILQAIEDVTGRKYRRIELFNDEPATTHACVLQVLCRTRESLLTGNSPARGPVWRSAFGRWLGRGQPSSA